MLLFLVKFTVTFMLLDHAVNETVKEIAASAYPISFINELEDEKIREYGKTSIPSPEDETKKLVKEFETGESGNLIKAVISGDLKDFDVSGALEGMLEDYGKGIIGGIIDSLTPAYWDMKAAGKYMIADELIKEYLDSPLINQSCVRLRLVELPQGEEEFKARSKGKAYEGFGLYPGRDFGSDDIVLQLEYLYRVNLPFMKAVEIKMVHTSVERAWINGSFGLLTAEDEGLNLEPDGYTVFITRTGIRYHQGSCRHLRKSKIPVSIEQAEEDGYTPCKVCKPLIADKENSDGG